MRADRIAARGQTGYDARVVTEVVRSWLFHPSSTSNKVGSASALERENPICVFGGGRVGSALSGRSARADQNHLGAIGDSLAVSRPDSFAIEIERLGVQHAGGLRWIPTDTRTDRDFRLGYHAVGGFQFRDGPPNDDFGRTHRASAIVASGSGRLPTGFAGDHAGAAAGASGSAARSHVFHLTVELQGAALLHVSLR